MCTLLASSSRRSNQAKPATRIICAGTLLSCAARLAAAGIGKSTLLNLIGGTLEPTVGHITRNAKVPPQLQPPSTLLCTQRRALCQAAPMRNHSLLTSAGLLRMGPAGA
jgi:ABC-type transport system involved in cytochrome bd biosynthesis fused ATPase/permease subunit